MNKSRSRGRPRGTSTTKDDILVAARRRFLEHGYDGVTLRAVATDAGVDVVTVPFPAEAYALARDGLSKGPRHDVRVFTGRRVEAVTLSLVDSADAGLRLERLGELSLFE